MCSRSILFSIFFFAIASFFYEVQAAPTVVALRDSPAATEVDHLGNRVKRQGGGGCGCCGCGGGCGCGCCGCGGGGGGCGCCCCRPRCCCQKCCTCCRTCCCTRCCTCCRPCCCGCGCGCCGCGGGGRKRRSLQNLRIKLAEKEAKRSVEQVESVPEINTFPAALDEPIVLPVIVRPNVEETDY